jgi:hypothetical protein
VRLSERFELDADLPRRVPSPDEVLLGRRLLRIVVPPFLVGEPAFRDEPLRGQARVLQVLFDDARGLLCLHPGRGVDEDRVVVPRDGQSLFTKLVGEQLRVAAGEVEAFEHAVCALLVGELYADPPVVLGHVGEIYAAGTWTRRSSSVRKSSSCQQSATSASRRNWITTTPPGVTSLPSRHAFSNRRYSSRPSPGA